ncbi:FAD-dependent oxidoreductase [Aquincola sp. S2]|uniref:D-amino-acid oxidase n=1 Tax=Pseudaquabacterium terrae TaxID=2732868 RepID=A0ABX2E9D0_9BURK|nr:FAD-dependent oxidoreductase [Aquabacterium terrae]NRF65571.1 FAD-dependent oxidoreductase [Aquabacterium terrae]
MHRRDLLLRSASTALAALPGTHARAADQAAAFAPPAALAPIRARPDRIIDVSVCTRPFRAQGPRIEAERRFGKTIVHNYGHGGSGWSLSWGAAMFALPLLLATRERHIAIVGCGAIGLTMARVAQRAGLRVHIYCKERPPEVRSSAATGMWSPESRLCTLEHATPAFAQQWEAMARSSFKAFQRLLGLPGDPIGWHDGYTLSDIPFDQPLPGNGHSNDEPEYPDLEARIRDLRPRSVVLAPHEHPFRVPHARRYTQMTFNLAAYSRLLLDEFMRDGGEIEQRDFVHLRQFAGLKERTIVNATGYGARALLGDHSIIPVRGQTARLVPQPEVSYGLIYRGHNVVVVPRRDGLLVQAQGERDFGNHNTEPDRGLSEAAVERLGRLFAA